MIALGRALVARGHDGDAADLAALARARRGGGNARSPPAPEYQVFPTGPEPLDFYEAVVHATLDTLPLVRELRPDVVVADILTLAPALAAELRGRAAGRRSSPTSTRTASRDFPIYSLGARLPRTRARARALAARAAPGRQRASSWAARELNETRARARPAGARARARRHQPRARARRDVPPARVPARVARATSTSSARCMWEPPAATSSCRRATRRSCWSRRRRRRTPSTGCCAPRCAGLADAPVRVLATWNRRLPPRPLARARQRAARRVGLLLAHDAALRRGRLPRRPRHARARAVQRLRRRRLPGGRRHERERGAARLGRRGRARAAALRLAAAAAAGGRAGAGRASYSARARELAGWAERNDAGAAAARLLERLAA